MLYAMAVWHKAPVVLICNLSRRSASQLAWLDLKHFFLAYMMVEQPAYVFVGIFELIVRLVPIVSTHFPIFLRVICYLQCLDFTQGSNCLQMLYVINFNQVCINSLLPFLFVLGKVSLQVFTSNWFRPPIETDPYCFNYWTICLLLDLCQYIYIFTYGFCIKFMKCPHSHKMHKKSEANVSTALCFI